MSKKFNMRNALCTLMACGATMGGISSVTYAAKDPTATNAPISPVDTPNSEHVNPAGGNFQLMSQTVIGKKRVRRMLDNLIESKVMGGKSTTYTLSDDPETKGVEKALYDRTKEAAKLDCINANDEPRDTRKFAGVRSWISSPDKNTDLEYTFMEDASSTEAVKTGMPRILKTLRVCFGDGNILKSVRQTPSLVTISLEYFFHAMENVNLQLKLLPNHVEYEDRKVVYDALITDSLETSIIGKILDLGLLEDADLKTQVEKMFGDMKNSWKVRIEAVKQVIDNKQATGTKEGPAAQNTKKNNGTQKKNGNPIKTQPKK